MNFEKKAKPGNFDVILRNNFIESIVLLVIVFRY